MKSVLVGIVVVAYFATSDAFSCYDCNSDLDAACNYGGSNLTTMECKYNKQCLKIVDENGEVVRSCVSNATWENITKLFLDSQVFTCKTELCNGVSTITAGLSTILALIAVFIVGVYN